MATDHARTYCLATVLVLTLAWLGSVKQTEVGRLYRAHILPPLVASCDSEAPGWIDQIGTWARLHDIPGLQIHLRSKGRAYDCSFGDAVSPDGLRRPMQHTTILLYASLTKVFTSALVLQSLDRSSRIYDLLGLDRLHLEHSHRWKMITIDMLLKHQAGFD